MVVVICVADVGMVAVIGGITTSGRIVGMVVVVRVGSVPMRDVVMIGVIRGVSDITGTIRMRGISVTLGGNITVRRVCMAALIGVYGGTTFVGMIEMLVEIFVREIAVWAGWPVLVIYVGMIAVIGRIVVMVVVIRVGSVAMRGIVMILVIRDIIVMIVVVAMRGIIVVLMVLVGDALHPVLPTAPAPS